MDKILVVAGIATFWILWFLWGRIPCTWFCRHWWQRDLIFGSGDYAYTVVRTCTKCRKSKVLFHGTYTEYQFWLEEEDE